MKHIKWITIACFFVLLCFIGCKGKSSSSEKKPDKENTFDKKSSIEKIAECIQKDDIEQVQEIFKENSFSQIQCEKIASLIYAKYKNLDVICSLVKYGMPVDLYFEGDTLLQIAVKGKEVKNVKTLLDMGADPCLFNKSGKYTAFTLSIQSFGNNTLEVFKELMSCVGAKDFGKIQQYGKPEENSIFWYYTMIIDKNKQDLLKVYLSKKEIFDEIIQDKEVLKYASKHSNMFCTANYAVLDSELPIDNEYDYFEQALYAENPDAIEYFLDKDIKISDMKFYESWLKYDYKNGDIQSAFPTTDDYARLVDLYEDVKKHYLHQEIIYKKYNDNYNSIDEGELPEIKFDGNVEMYDLNVNDTEENAYKKIQKYYKDAKKDYTFEGIVYYTDLGLYSNNNVVLEYYGGKFLGFRARELTRDQLQAICDKFRVTCYLSRLKDGEFYMVKSGKWRFRFIHNYGTMYEYSIEDAETYKRF